MNDALDDGVQPMTVRFPVRLIPLIDKRAAFNRRSRNAEIVFLLESSLRDDSSLSAVGGDDNVKAEA